jgi:hypothetical protein
MKRRTSRLLRENKSPGRTIRLGLFDHRLINSDCQTLNSSSQDAPFWHGMLAVCVSGNLMLRPR